MRTENKVIDPLSPYSRALKKIEESGIRPTKQRRILAKLIFEKVTGIYLLKIFLMK